MRNIENSHPVMKLRELLLRHLIIHDAKELDLWNRRVAKANVVSKYANPRPINHKLAGNMRKNHMLRV